MTPKSLPGPDPGWTPVFGNDQPKGDGDWKMKSSRPGTQRQGRVVAPTQEPQMSSETTPKQLLHLVFGGELTDLEHVDFKDLSTLDIVGIFPNYAAAYMAWKAKAQGTVDNAHMRYF